MIENRDIQQGAVTLTKLSKNLRLPLANVEAGTAGQVPVVQSNGDLAYKAIGGDATLNADGNLAVTLAATTTDTIPEGSSNLYYTDARVDARVRQIKHEADQQATNEEPGFMPKEDKAKLDATPDTASAIRKFDVRFTWGTAQAGVSYPDGTSGTKAKITHPLDSESVICSVMDVDGSLVSDNTQLDMNFEDHVVVTVDSPSEVTLAFNPDAAAPAIGETYLVTIIG